VQVLSISREDDLALVQLQLADGEHCTPVVLGDSTALQVGDAVVAIGNPLGLASSVTAGIVVDKDQGIHVKRHFDKLHMLETDAAINGGNSGGGLVDLRGRLVGINSAGSSGLQNRGYAIPVDHVRHQILSLLLSPEKLRSPSLGMEVVDQDGTVRVAKVATGGPAERAGVHQGDRVLRLQGQAIDWSPAFALTLMRQPTDAPSKLALERDGVPLELQVEVLTASQWAVVRQSGLELADLPFAADPKLVQDAATALQRRFTGDGNAVPTEFPEQVVRVRRLHPRLQAEKVDVQPGDLLLAVDLEHTTTAGDATALRRFGKVQDVQALFNDRNLGSYEGTKFRCWLYRAGAITVVEIEAKRLMP
jgi:hypothetical protein